MAFTKPERFLRKCESAAACWQSFHFNLKETTTKNLIIYEFHLELLYSTLHCLKLNQLLFLSLEKIL